MRSLRSPYYLLPLLTALGITGSVGALQPPSSAPAPLQRERAAPRPDTLTLADAEAVALELLDRSFLMGEGPDSDLEVRWVRVDALGMAHVRVRQTYAGIPVLFGESTVHLHPDGSLRAITGALFPGLSLDPFPSLTPDEAIQEAAWLSQQPTYRPGRIAPHLLIYTREAEPRLAYEVPLEHPSDEASSQEPHVYFIDAHSGEPLFHYIDRAAGNATGSGAGNYYSSSALSTFYVTHEGQYYLQDTSSNLDPLRAISTLMKPCVIVDPQNEIDEISELPPGCRQCLGRL